MSDLFNLEIVRDFSKEYQFLDFLELVYNCTNVAAIDEIEREENLRWFADFLLADYVSKRWNPFSLNYSVNNDLRFINEARKSASLVRVDIKFLEAHQKCKTVDDIKAVRSDILSKYFMDYEDRRWQYYWVEKMLIPQESEEDFEWDIDILFMDKKDNYKKVPDFLEDLDTYYNPDYSWKYDSAYA